MQKSFYNFIPIFFVIFLIFRNEYMLAEETNIPKLVNYQGYLTDADGKALDGSYNITFRLYDESSGENPWLWQETHDTVRVVSGQFNVLLGSINQLSADDFTDVRYLGVELAGETEMTPRMQLVSVAYSLCSEEANHALTADEANNAQTSDQATNAQHAQSADQATNANIANKAHTLVNNVAFSAYVASNELFNEQEPLELKSTSTNIGNHFDIETSKFTAPVTGLYLFTLTGLSSATTNNLWWCLMVNDYYANSTGVNIFEVGETCVLSWLTGNITSSRTVILKLYKGDKVHVKQTGTGRCDNFRSGLEGALLYEIVD